MLPANKDQQAHADSQQLAVLARLLLLANAIWQYHSFWHALCFDLFVFWRNLTFAIPGACMVPVYHAVQKQPQRDVRERSAGGAGRGRGHVRIGESLRYMRLSSPHLESEQLGRLWCHRVGWANQHCRRQLQIHSLSRESDQRAVLPMQHSFGNGCTRRQRNNSQVWFPVCLT